jgi:hypothetical protein
VKVFWTLLAKTYFGFQTNMDVNIGIRQYILSMVVWMALNFLCHYPCSRAIISATKRAGDTGDGWLEAYRSVDFTNFRFSEALGQVFHEIIAFKDSLSYSANLRNENGQI